MGQELLNQLAITAQQAGWDATAAANFQSIQEYIRTFAITKKVQGGTGTPSDVEIQTQDAKNSPSNVTGATFLRVRVCNQDGYANATNATIAVYGGSTVVETLTANKDLIIKSDANGKFEVRITDGTAETFTIRIGPAGLSPHFGNYHNSLNIAHA